MPQSEQEILDRLSKVENDCQDAKRKLAAAKKRYTEAETVLIDAGLKRDRILEELEKFRAHAPRHEVTMRDLEIERFRKDNPEVVELARLRDQKK